MTKLIRKIAFRVKLWMMDDWWRYTGASSYELFPPSFYYTHTAEEAKQIIEDKMKKIQDMINQLD